MIGARYLGVQRGAARLIVLISLVLLAVGCRDSSSPDRPPGYAVVGIESQPLHLDPRYSTDANSTRISRLLYDSLLRSDERLQLQPQLAQSWRMLDERTYQFELRPDVRFHTGKPLTAADVKYTYESILHGESRSPKRALLKPLQAVEVLSPHRVLFRLSEPHAPFVEQFTFGIVEGGSGTPTDSARTRVVGSGPFILESLEPGTRVTLKANPSYWGGPPNVAGLVFKIIPDAMVRVLEFKQGTIDLLQNDIEPDMLPWLKRNTDALIEAQPGTTFQYIGMNLTHPILRHQKVRQALALAIDREAIIRHLLKDLALPANSLLSPFNWAYDETILQWRYDPTEAKRLLDEAGYPDPDGDGPAVRFRLSFKTTNIDLRRRIAEAFKDQLKQVGIELEIRSYEWGTFYSDVRKGNFHLFSLAWVGIQDPDIYYQIFHSASMPPHGNNRGRYSNAELDRLLEHGRSTPDVTKRKRLYAEAQQIVARDLPYIPLWWVKNVAVKNPSLTGFVLRPDGDFSSLKQVSLRVPPL